MSESWYAWCCQCDQLHVHGHEASEMLAWVIMHRHACIYHQRVKVLWCLLSANSMRMSYTHPGLSCQLDIDAPQLGIDLQAQVGGVCDMVKGWSSMRQSSQHAI